MRVCLLICFLCFTSLCTAQDPEKDTQLHLSLNNLNNYLGNWKFYPGDNPSMAAKEYNDSAWQSVNPAMWYGQPDTATYPLFDGIGWFRLHFRADSSLIGRPLAYMVAHLGASELYLDGKLLKKFGKIDGPDSTIHRNPQGLPYTFILHDTGHHVFALRYANFNAARNHDFYNHTMAGFSFSLEQADRAIFYEHRQALALSLVVILLFGIFLTLSLLHLLLFLYHKSDRSNLFFSLFSLSLALGLLTPYLIRFTTYPEVRLITLFTGTFIIALGSFSLSGFVNTLFSKNLLRFKIIGILCLIAIALRFVDSVAVLIGNAALMTIVAIETVVLVVRAMVRGVRGARIMGAGILFFCLFFLSVVAYALIFQELDFNDSTTTGQIIELILALTILSIPLSMSGYLAWNFSRINKDLKTQLEQVKLLSAKTLQQEQEKQHLLETRQEELEREVDSRTAELLEEKNRSDELLRNVLPEEVAEELKWKGASEAKYFDQVTVLFTDFVNFTQAGERMTPKELVDELHACFKAFDDIISSHGIEKIKTIGDAYLAVCGLPVADPDHACKVVRAAVEILAFMEDRHQQLGEKSFRIRIGIHSGPVVAGIVGVKKFAYDIWGDTVNTAARMEQASEAGRINISQTTYELVKDSFACSFRGEIAAKNKGSMTMYFIERQPISAL